MTGASDDDPADDDPGDDDLSVCVELDVDENFDPERLSICAYWRCGELFERRTSNQRFCRKACRSRQNKWLRAVERRRARSQR